MHYAVCNILIYISLRTSIEFSRIQRVGMRCIPTLYSGVVYSVHYTLRTTNRPMERNDKEVKGRSISLTQAYKPLYVHTICTIYMVLSILWLFRFVL